MTRIMKDAAAYSSNDRKWRDRAHVGCKSDLKKDLRNHERGLLNLLIGKHEQSEPDPVVHRYYELRHSFPPDQRIIYTAWIAGQRWLLEREDALPVALH